MTSTMVSPGMRAACVRNITLDHVAAAGQAFVSCACVLSIYLTETRIAYIV